MISIQHYVRAKSMEHAFQLLSADSQNAVLGGNLILRLSSRKIKTAIDLSGLDLNYIRENSEFIEIGAMTTLRDIETSGLLKKWFSGVLPRTVAGIAGVQVRNQATVGGTIGGRYGFSDLLTVLLALDAKIELYGKSILPLANYLANRSEPEIIEKLLLPKTEGRASFQSARISRGDFALLNVAAAYVAPYWRISVGARPAVAREATTAMEFLNKLTSTDRQEIAEAAATIAVGMEFGDTMKTGAAYRRMICPVLARRAMEEIWHANNV